MDANGLLSGAGSVIIDLQVHLFQAVKSKTLDLAQTINDRIYPLAKVFYSAPFLDMQNRMKEALVLLSRIEQAEVHPQLVKTPNQELKKLNQALKASGMGLAL